MIRKIMWNDVRHHKMLSGSTMLFMAVSTMLITLTVLLFTGLLSSVNGLMERAKTPDFLQMHAGDIEEERIASFAENHPEISEWQICRFLNLENGTLSLGNNSLADSTQDNGLCVQGDGFDYLLDLENGLPTVLEGEVYVPICYRSLYNLSIGDEMQIGKEKLIITGFLRDSQMNSMMASSKRFLVNAEDYEKMKGQGEEEYLIEFRFEEGVDVDSFGVAYGEAELFANGPTITKSLILMMNALSDGIMILVILLVSIVVLLISLLCIRFITAIRMEQDKKEVGMLKALGIGKTNIRFLYFSKYILLSICGALIGFVAASILQTPLAGKMKELYGEAGNGLAVGVIALLSVVLVQVFILCYIWRKMKKIEKMSALEAMFSVEKRGKKEGKGQYILIGLVAAACAFLVLVPQNLYSTMASPGFVTYMGIGNGEIRIDVRQTENISQRTEQLAAKLNNDEQVLKYTVLKTRACPAYLSNGTPVNLIVETGNHSVFPVSYAKGRQPMEDREIALSTLNAQELGLSVGDTLKLQRGGRKEQYTVCGIYSDITNGGKTAKAGSLTLPEEENDQVMWSILYISLQESVSREQWISKYSQTGVDIIDIADYVQGTYGQTLRQIQMAKKVAVGIAVLIIFVVVMLFMRLIVERKRYSISLQKALGFTGTSIRKAYLVKGIILIVAGTAAGLLLGNTVGESICGLILQSFGAEGFHFVIAWKQVLLVIPIILTGTAVAAVWSGIWEVKKIKAFECCMGKE